VSDSMGDKLKGVAKETAGKVTGDDSKVREGEEEQKRAQKADEADRLEEQAEQKRAQEAGHKGEQMKHQD
jgi:uncharacterized protein YjbJ (UPF0337 family)